RKLDGVDWTLCPSREIESRSGPTQLALVSGLSPTQLALKNNEKRSKLEFASSITLDAPAFESPQEREPKEVEPAPKQKQKRESNSEDSISAAKKLKTEQEQDPGVDLGEGNKDSGREMGFKIEADAAEDKGLRHAMEDAWVVLLDTSLDFPGKLRCAHFAIYDGHGGRLAAEYAQKHLHTNVLSAGLPRELLDVKTAKKAILDGFRKTDESVLQESAAGGWQDGATAVFVANIGDAKAVVARSSPAEGLKNGSDEACHLKAIVLTREHKAIYAQERARIQKAGGNVSSNGRLQGRLEVSRAFGDRHFKKVGVVATPDIHSFDLTEREHFIILGCDGLWGDAVAFVQKLLKEGLPVSTISRRLVKEAVRERRCKDNCTVIIIMFRHK
ncbi:Protein phosphatase 2C family protein, partial [Prunus dulcis]